MRNKYGAVVTNYNDYSYHSGLEAAYAFELDLRLKAKDIKSWKRQETIHLMAYGKTICKYTIDFVVTHNDGHLEYIEVKGMPTSTWRIKWKLFVAQLAVEEPSARATIKTKKDIKV